MWMRMMMATALGLAACAASAAEPLVRAREDGPEVRFTLNGRLVAVYKHDHVPFKPYLKELYTPQGVNVLRDAPPDHQHHHALMFAVAADGVNFWEEAAGAGRQVEQRLGVRGDGLQEALAWTGPDGKQILREQRSVAVAPMQGTALVTWRSELAPAAGQAVKLTGSHYFGLGMRLPESMEKTTTFLLADEHPAGENVRGDEWVRNSAWVAAQGKVDGKPVTVALFDHPDNPRYPNRIFTMNIPFAYQSLTLNLWKEPLSIEAGKTLQLTYGAAAWDGILSRQQIQAAYDQWVRLTRRAK